MGNPIRAAALFALVGGVALTVAAVRPSTSASEDVPVLALQDTAAGKAIFTGKGNCHVCHGMDAKGTPLAPDLTDTKWLNIDGSLAAIEKLVTTGVPAPKEHPAAMPPKGGAALTDAEVKNVAAYVFSLSHKK